MAISKSLKTIPPIAAGAAAMGAGAVTAAMGVVQLLDPNKEAGTDVIGWAGYSKLAMLVVALLLIAPVYLTLARWARWEVAGAVAAAGTVVLALTCITSLVNGEDLAAFNVLAPFTNAAWLFGSIALAISLRQTGRVRTAVAVGLPLAWVAMLPLSSFGGPLVAGAYWIWVGRLLREGSIEDEQEAELGLAPA